MVAIDSQILVWGLQLKGDPKYQQRARWLFDQLEHDGAQIIVPAVVVSEYLIPIDPRKHAATIADLSSRFLLMPFDVQCASMAARLFQEGRDDRTMGTPNARKTLRADAMIVATAACRGATTLYSHDTHCRALADRVMTSCDLPDQPADLFGFEPEESR